MVHLAPSDSILSEPLKSVAVKPSEGNEGVDFSKVEMAEEAAFPSRLMNWTISFVAEKGFTKACRSSARKRILRLTTGPL